MKPKINKAYSRLKIVAIQAAIIICAFVVLESCRCVKGFTITDPNGKSKFETYRSYHPGFTSQETESCTILGLKIWPNIITPNTSDSSGNEGVRSGEHFATTITAAPLLNFKSSNEEYGGGYGEHKPGIGFSLGVGTVLPFNQRWAIAPSIRLTQKNASETIGYSEPGGSSSEFTDKYSYSYVGGLLLAQYRAGKHISLVAGPEVNYLVSASVKNSGSSGTGEKQSLNNSSQKWGIDMLAGIKFELPAKSGRSKWGLQLMYDHRLSRLNEKKDESGMEIPAYKMKSIQLGLAYNICGSCGKKK